MDSVARDQGGPVDDPAMPGSSGTRLTRWRLRSGLCAWIDTIAGLAGVGLFVLVAVDCVYSWPSDAVLLPERDLSLVAGWVLLPFWPWMIASLFVIFGIPARDQRRRSRRGGPRAWRMSPLPRSVWVRACLAGVALVCAAVLIGGFTVGQAKGDARILPGPRYEVSTLDLNQANWTPVSAAQYHLWQARFVRGDAILATFGVALVAVSLGLLELHRREIRSR